jgi:hypothetical protein
VSFADLRRRAAVVRAAPLESVLILRGAARDGHDRHKWHTERGSLSVTGAKFMNWHTGQGGGGAIDLLMHLAQVDFRTALFWLEEHLVASHIASGGPAAHASSRESSPSEGAGQVPACGWRLPVRDDRLLNRVRQYLTQRRYLAASLVEPLIASGKLYADRRGNAVFVLAAGRANRPVGAELRGTGPRVWRGMTPGANKDSGYFWIGVSRSREIVLCESAIDAMSCFQMHPQRICISTSGVRADPPWLGGLIARGYELHCGFDADGPGDAAAARMITLHSQVKRLRPSAHDWNDLLTSTR